MNTDAPNITIPLAEYIDIACSYRGNSVITRARGEIIAQHIDPSEELCHIEFPDNPGQENVSILWRIKDWKDDAKRWQLLKQNSEWDRQYSYAYKELLGEIMLALMENPMFSDILTPDLARAQSSKLIDKQHWPGIVKLGVAEDKLSRIKELLNGKPKKV